MKSEAYQAALEFAAKKHEGQVRKGGSPYIIHPKAVEMLEKSLEK